MRPSFRSRSSTAITCGPLRESLRDDASCLKPRSPFEWIRRTRHGLVGIVPKHLFLGFLSLTPEKVMSARLDAGKGIETRDTPSAGKFQRVGKAGPRRLLQLA